MLSSAHRANERLRRSRKAKRRCAQNEPLATTFPCLFCNHEKSVIVKLDKKAGVGQLSCKVCNQTFQCAVNYLSAAVDVYSDWVDACDAVAKANGGEEGDIPARAPVAGRPSGGGGRARDEDDDDNDDDILNDEDGMGGYGGDGIVADDDY
ncbi:transcription elongation factor Elf1 like-domain-containing protein [Tricladium varicosporioides]|nr:transcription elongation factor Elf1 like-domain-containing protein [Hymenoscyphus varicosporioides]